MEWARGLGVWLRKWRKGTAQPKNDIARKAAQVVLELNKEVEDLKEHVKNLHNNEVVLKEWRERDREEFRKELIAVKESFHDEYAQLKEENHMIRKEIATIHAAFSPKYPPLRPVPRDPRVQVTQSN